MNPPRAFEVLEGFFEAALLLKDDADVVQDVGIRRATLARGPGFDAPGLRKEVERRVVLLFGLRFRRPSPLRPAEPNLGLLRHGRRLFKPRGGVEGSDELLSRPSRQDLPKNRSCPQW